MILVGLVILVAAVLAMFASLRRFETAARILGLRVKDVGALETSLAVTQTRLATLAGPLAEAERRAITLRAHRGARASEPRHSR